MVLAVPIEGVVLVVWGAWVLVILWHIVVTAILMYHWKKYTIETARIVRLRTQFLLFSCIASLVATMSALAYSASVLW